MLVLSRKAGESVVIDGGVRVTVVEVKGNRVRLGIEAPEHVSVVRSELCESSSPWESHSSLQTAELR